MTAFLSAVPFRVKNKIFLDIGAPNDICKKLLLRLSVICTKSEVFNKTLLGSSVEQLMRKIQYHRFNRLMPTTGFDLLIGHL